MLLGQRQAECRVTPVVMGVLNVTPDSFSDGGAYPSHEAAIARALEMIDEGAGIIDVGPESTRPGSGGVSEEEQIARAIPVIRGLRERHARVGISIDTRAARVAKEAIEAGADMVNDVSALRDDPELVEVVASSGAAIVLMHMRGTPAEMQGGGGPKYEDVVGEIAAFLSKRADWARQHGVDAERIIVDPGIGFGKRVEHNLAILKHLDRFVGLGHPVLVGASRKSFIGHVLEVPEPKRRLAGSLGCAAIAVMAGVSIIRVHDVRETVEVVRMCSSIRDADAPETLSGCGARRSPALRP
ncbi:MAG: dihydropteroate synthase [Phycisphaerae bacterium]